MKIKFYLFRFAVGLTAFISGISFFGVGQYLKSVFPTKKQETAAIQPLIKEEIAFVAPPVPELSISEQTNSTSDLKESADYEVDISGEYFIVTDLPP